MDNKRIKLEEFITGDIRMAKNKVENFLCEIRLLIKNDKIKTKEIFQELKDIETFITERAIF